MKRSGIWWALTLTAVGGATLANQVTASPTAAPPASAAAGPYRDQAARAGASASAAASRGDTTSAALWRRVEARWLRVAQNVELAQREEQALATESQTLREGDSALSQGRESLSIALGRQARAEADLRAAVASAGPIASCLVSDLPPLPSTLLAPAASAPAAGAPAAPAAAPATGPAASSTPATCATGAAR